MKGEDALAALGVGAGGVIGVALGLVAVAFIGAVIFGPAAIGYLALTGEIGLRAGIWALVICYYILVVLA